MTSRKWNTKITDSTQKESCSCLTDLYEGENEDMTDRAERNDENDRCGYESEEVLPRPSHRIDLSEK
jgi:hypothetical protein